mmetsp:Transcript_20320/g.33514  ORF Transcript_20320/g.33514 Transcript_20320/m.33514 type:complete len:476 (+) Transcript_20320:252-1679(+)|eukprot:CAMPEP_0203746284 /NCGR_PEP_ID=MMETSP0098-20131031/1769_1 /ASSEMBLY_ACC=CAM_ASM_000208 /TAXON_ID=96639 /ORGANISM=" , Strain NY0313808BC1" /LENGTH=475 /DNA_ID=CAMNT_0050634315 /DNA_START=261 /DNA_END=1691 /DNA_ORIENTATION=+
MFGGFRKKDKNKSNAKKTDGGVGVNNNNANAAVATTNAAPNKQTAPPVPPAGDRFENLTLLSAVSLKDVPPSEQPQLFRKHLELCRETFSFEPFSTGDMLFPNEKEAKRILLLGLVDYINNPNTRITESVFPDIISMVSGNIFRSLPPRSDMLTEVEDEETVLEAAWPHLQIVYEFLLRFIVSGDVEPKVAKKYISHSFILHLLELFDSEDPRERDYLKTILHRIYGKFMALRAFIRKSISNVFLSSIYLLDKHNGIAELLEILGSIINGFALPLKAEHKRFLLHGLIPLHRVQSIGMFHQQLEYCVTQFAEKDNKMAEPAILGLLRYWPETSSPKQVQFLHELEELLELTQLPEFRKIMVPLFVRLSTCLGSQHFQVAERTLLLWNNEYLFTLVTQNRTQILPIVFDVLSVNSANHWNPTVQSLSQNVLKSFQDTDKGLYEEVEKSNTKSAEERAEARVKRIEMWEKLELDHQA